MFVGAVPRQAVEQITRAVPFTEWREVFVGCSGSIRFDRAVQDVHPTVRVHSNDVSLLSCALGALATGAEFAIGFKGRLAFVEDTLGGEPFAARVAAVEVALEMAKYKGANSYAQAHFAHYQERFAEFLAPAWTRLDEMVAKLHIASFHAGDFREQARRAAAVGGGVAAFPPTYKNGYERLYRFVDESTDWARPSYEIWDPAKVEDWLDDLDLLGVRYCVLTDHTLDHHEPVTVYRGQTNKPVFTFADQATSSVRRTGHNSQPFRYRALDPALLTPTSDVEIINATSAQMNFLKDIYLAKGIAHTSGIANFLVLIDGQLAGGFIFARAKFGGDVIYMLSDFALSPRSRVSKLVAMLATCSTVIEPLEIKLVQRIAFVVTTAFTDKPVSMKYRGIFEIIGRGPGKINYASKVRRTTRPESTPGGSSGSLQTRVTRVRLSDLKLPEKNARFLKGPAFAQLVANIKRDGCLTSFPLVNRQGDDLTVASGSHRVAAAMKAGLIEHDVIEITSPLTREQFVALQLSHNAIVGEDDPNVLRALYDELGFEWKEYSGLTDDAFKVEDLDMSVLRIKQPFYEELFISFLPADLAIFNDWLDKIGKARSAAPRMVGLYADFGRFFEQLLTVKRATGVHNTAVALRLMAELAGEALAARDAEGLDEGS